jgi:hypothetical protein
MPHRISSPSIASECEAGPTVQTILARRREDPFFAASVLCSGAFGFIVFEVIYCKRAYAAQRWEIQES